MSSKKVAFLAAGGTGGHLFPAEALAHVLKERGWQPHLLTDDRGLKFATNFPGEVHKIPSETLRGTGLFSVLRMLIGIGRGYARSTMLMRKHTPSIMIGFGGYPSLPPMLAASSSGLPTIVHEQNGIMGKANRLVAKKASAVAVAIPRPGLAPEGVRLIQVGNPVRDGIRAAAEVAYPSDDKGLRLLVFGGSQGASVLTQHVPDAVAGLDEGLRAQLFITQQAGEEDVATLKERYAALRVKGAEVAPFFSDIAYKMAESHLIICRSGASTVAELSAVGRPSILVPLKQSREGDQAANARFLQDHEAAELLPQTSLEAGELQPLLRDLLADRAKREKMAARAKEQGRVDAGAALADLVERLAKRD